MRIIFKKYLKIVLIFLLFGACFKINADTIDEFESAVKEVEMAYYRRGANIQYQPDKTNTSKAFFSPEESTSQNINYLACSVVPYNVYYELLGIELPQFDPYLNNHARDNFGKPEVIAYGFKNNDNDLEMYFNTGKENEKCVYDDREIEGCKKEVNPLLGEIIEYLRPGDVLTYTKSSTHVIMIYDLKYDNNGKVIDAYTLESGHGGDAYVNTKINLNNHNLFLNSRMNNGITEGSLHFSVLSELGTWKNLISRDNYEVLREEYSVLRFVNNINGKAVLTYSGNEKDGSEITLTSKDKDRIKYKGLYIEKTVDVHNDDVVEYGDTLTYKIIIQNTSDSDYTQDLIVTEYLSEYVTYKEYNSTASNTAFNKNNNTLTFNIGKLKSSEKVTITYKVLVDKGMQGQLIKSTGKVANIPSSTIRNTIGNNLTNEETNRIIEEYNALKSTKNGKELINDIYLNALGIDFGFNNFDIAELVKNTAIASNGLDTIVLNNKNSLYGAILNKYYNTLWKNNQGKFSLKLWGLHDELRRADTIYSENFKTGDVLIYRNGNEATTNGENFTTYEDGDYYYIYISGKGFVGVNIGADGITNTKDDRNEFNANYYKSNNLILYRYKIETDLDFLEYVNYQTLFGKDYYVILRPSLSMFNCNSGYYLAASATSCSVCPIGSYCPGGSYIYNGLSNQGIINCSKGYTTSNIGSTEQSSCIANIYKINLDVNNGIGGTTTIYEKYNTGWYSDSLATIKITSVTIPTKKGYTFGGYYYNTDFSGAQWINENGIINLDASATSLNNITLHAKWINNSSLKNILENNGYEVSNGFVSKFTLGESISSIRDKLGNDITIDTSSAVITTGVIFRNANESYIAVIEGDINGDGNISSLDYIKVKNHIMGSKTIEGNEYLEAADYNSDNKISALDYVGIKNYIMK